jgi:hypothetical protein
MAEATATIESGSDNARRMEDSLRKQHDAPPRMLGDMNAGREVKFYIHIYNLGPIEHRIERPWAIGGRIVIPACLPGQDYSESVNIPDVVQEKTFVSGSNEFGTRGVDGKFLAQDALNPDDPTGSWKSVRPINQGLTTNIGTNLYNFGCFWTLASPPEAEAVASVKSRMEKFFNDKITEAGTFWVAQQDSKYNGDRVSVVHHTIADYFGIETDWHRKFKSRKPCPGCGESLAENAVCCLRCPATFDWNKSVKLGLRTKQQALDAGIVLK